jgi:hypothetical protein
MAWLFISVPIMVLAVAVAVVPVAWQSARFHLHEHGRRPVAPARTSSRVGSAAESARAA